MINVVKENTESLELIVVKDNRIEWIDALKFIGIFLIYIAHFGDIAGKTCLFAYTFHVPLFFFISGLFSLKHREDPIGIYILNKVKTILIPYFVFSLLTIFIMTIQTNYIPIPIKDVIRDILFGTRNQIFASQLWFFPCLLLVEIFFQILLKLLKNKYYVLMACIGIFLLAEGLFYENYVVLPRLWFNMDAALYYLLYYAIGAVSFEKLRKLNFNSMKLKGKSIFLLCVIASIFIAFITFFEKDFYFKNIFLRLPFGKSLYDVFIALSLIFLNILIAKKISNFKLICNMGKNTLWLCGNESVVKIIVPVLYSVLGLNRVISTPLHTIIYAFILLLFGEKIVVPIEKKIIGNLFNSLYKS